MPQMCFEAAAGQFQQLGGGLEVDLGAEYVLVSEVRGQPRQLGMDIDAGQCPRRQPMDNEGVSVIPYPELEA
jgi:hypothetical protein